MTAQEAYEHHRARAFRDRDGPGPAGADWDDPLERVAVVGYAMSYGTPADVWSDVNAPGGRKRLDHAWAGLPPSTRALYRSRAGVSLLATGQVVAP